MRSDPQCPMCTENGWLVGRDEKGRDLFACLTPGCEVVEYDREIIRHRKGLASVPGARVVWARRGVPAYRARGQEPVV